MGGLQSVAVARLPFGGRVHPNLSSGRSSSRSRSSLGRLGRGALSGI